MNKKIVILTIPGIGSKKAGYSEDFKEDVLRFTNNTVRKNLQFIETLPFKETGVDQHQKDLFYRLKAKNNLGGILSLRKIVIEAFGDAVTFERNADAPDSNYRKIHSYLRTQFEQANALLNPGDIFVILAASMGVQVLSTYIWDADKGRGIFGDGNTAKPNQNLENLDYLATIGCNIPLFVSGSPEKEIVAFKKRNDHFTWDNFYDKDDVLGWPLKQLSDSYGTLVEDHEINTGIYVGAHVKYWDDNDFTMPFSEKLNQLYG